jgi:hypothetical protein
VLLGEFLMVKAKVPETASSVARMLSTAILAKVMGVLGIAGALASWLYRRALRVAMGT